MQQPGTVYFTIVHNGQIQQRDIKVTASAVSFGIRAKDICLLFD